MARIKGQLKIKDLGSPSEAKLAQARTLVKHKQPEAPAEPPQTARLEPAHHRFPHLSLLIIAVVLVLTGIGASVALGWGDAGDVGINELTAKDIVININSRPHFIATNAETVGDVLREQGIHFTSGDYMDKKKDQPVVEGMKIWLRLSVPIRIIADGQIHLLESQPITVSKALSLAGIELGANDTVSLPLLSYVYDETEIQVHRIEIRTETVDEYIDQPETTVEYEYLVAGARAVVSEGSPGVNRNTYRVTYRDGQEVGRVLLDAVKVRDPKERVIGIGPANSKGTATKAMAITDDGASFYFHNSYTMEATAYTWTGNTTATGTWPKVGTIAVDPDIIPLGTKVYVAGYGFAVAEDTGGAINDYIIDLYMDTENQCISWGRRQVTVYMLN
ncbi:MAG: DUF348 domain-containing protein [Clostridia bacterium]|nr:DUF348 domain-containing protein [Clostridia bacterium]